MISCPIPSGKHTKLAIEAMAIEIVDFPSYKMVDVSIVMGQFTRGYPW